jgi:hypothetical protein
MCLTRLKSQRSPVKYMLTIFCKRLFRCFSFL